MTLSGQALTILLYGRTGAGKTTQIGVLAEDLFKRTKKKTRLYTVDGGGSLSIQPYVNLGIIELVPLGATDVWLFADRASKGMIRDPQDLTGNKWIQLLPADIGLVAYESAHQMAKLMQQDMERLAGIGRTIGGDANTSFDVGPDAGKPANTSGEDKIRVGSTKGYQKFAIPQDRILFHMMESAKLPVDIVLWSAGVNKDDDDITSSQRNIGPQVIGNALTNYLPAIFNYTLRIDVVPAKTGQAEKHLLYLGTHTDSNAGNATALGNLRRPLDAPLTSAQTILDPANLAAALKILRDDAVATSEKAIAKRLGLSQAV